MILFDENGKMPPERHYLAVSLDAGRRYKLILFIRDPDIEKFPVHVRECGHMSFIADKVVYARMAQW